MLKRGVWRVVAMLGMLGGMMGAAGAVLGAEPREEVQGAVKKLVEGGNFTWDTVTDVEDPLGALGGWKDKDTTLYTVAQFQATSQALEQGGKVVVRMDDGAWKTLAEVAEIATAARAAEMAARAALAEGIEAVPRYETVLNNSLQYVMVPTVELAEVAERLTEVKKAGAVYTAELSKEVATALLMNRRPSAPVPAGATASAPATASGTASGPATGRGTASGPAGVRRRPEPTEAKGTAVFTLKDGVVAKYDVHVSGTFVWNGQERTTQRSFAMEFSAVGTTTVTVAAEAKAKLAGMGAETRAAGRP